MGYMGSGKSTIGRFLEKILSLDFVDLDDYIIAEEGKSIPDIFNEKGEIYFRKQEHHYLKEILCSDKDLILSLGGGTPCYGNNLDLIQDSNNSTSVYLKGSVTFLVDRLFKERSSRPLISHIGSPEELQEYIGKHLFERNQYYSRADHIIEIDNKTVKDIVEEVVFRLLQ